MYVVSSKCNVVKRKGRDVAVYYAVVVMTVVRRLARRRGW